MNPGITMQLIENEMKKADLFRVKNLLNLNNNNNQYFFKGEQRMLEMGATNINPIIIEEYKN